MTRTVRLSLPPFQLSLALTLSVSLLLSLAACERSDAGPPVVVQTRTLEAGHLTTLPNLSFDSVEVLCDGESDACRLTQVPTADEREDGAVALVNGFNNPTVIVLRTGQPVRTVGRAGDGPGEYRIIHAIGFDGDAHLRTYGLMQRRLMRFAIDGADPAVTSQAAVPSGIPLDMRFVGGAMRILSNEPLDGADSSEVGMYEIAPNAPAARRLHGLGVNAAATRIDAMISPGPSFGPRPQWVITPEGGAARTTGEFLLEWFDSTGARTHRLDAPIRGRAVIESDLENSGMRRSINLPDGPMRRALAQAERNVASEHAPITRLVAGRDGVVWVRGVPREGMDSVPWYPITREQGPAAQVWLGADDRILAASAGQVLLLQDDSGERSARVLRVRLR